MYNKSHLDKPIGGSPADIADAIAKKHALPAIADPDDGEVHLTPKEASTGAEGTMFYNGLDDHVYVGVEP